MTHKGNLLCKRAWESIAVVVQHFAKQKQLYGLLTQKIMSQLYIGVCTIEQMTHLSAKNSSDSRFNSQLIPTRNIRLQTRQICKTLQYASQQNCGSYYEAHRLWQNNGSIGMLCRCPNVSFSRICVQGNLLRCR